MPELGPYGSVRGARGNSRILGQEATFTAAALASSGVLARCVGWPQRLCGSFDMNAGRADPGCEPNIAGGAPFAPT
jgi:hypothetical protein